jgi:perosamine synthetase
MTNIEASLGLAQMERLDSFLEKKRLFDHRYREELKSYAAVSFQKVDSRAESSCWLTCLTFPEEVDIPSLQTKMKGMGIPTRRIFMPLTEFPYLSGFSNGLYKNAAEIFNRGLCLPSSTLNSEEDIVHVCKAIKGFLS